MPETTTSRAFRENLRREREARSWAQGELARQLRATGAAALGHQTTLARIESGQRPVKLEEAVTIARVLDISLDKLLVVPEAVTTLDRATDSAFEMKTAHQQIGEAVTNFLLLRTETTGRRAEVVQYADAGAYEGSIGQHVEEMLELIDQALTLTVEDAVAQSTDEWKRGTGGGGDDA